MQECVLSWTLAGQKITIHRQTIGPDGSPGGGEDGPQAVLYCQLLVSGKDDMAVRATRHTRVPRTELGYETSAANA